ncbi:MAG: MobF family relaxase [Chitinophagaceae bacterium]
MLRITMNKSAGGAKKYYSEEYYREGQSNELEYYSEKNQVIGKWGGKATEMLGLDENILKKDFADLCDNINPETGDKLTSRNDVDRRVGYDFTFNASKSVSLAHTFASEADKKEILKAFQSSVHETMTEVETGMQARVRDKGKNENRETGNIVYGEFTHFTTRPIDGVPDPHLHSHCFIFNATYDEHDKKFKAGEFAQIKQDAPYYEAVFHSKLADKLEAIGYKTERTENGFELKGIDKSTLDKFSRRTKEIEDYAKEHEITGDKEKSQIGSKTREAKRVDIKPEEQADNWKGRLSEKELSEIVNLRNSKSDNQNSNSNKSAKEAVQYSLDHHLERKSVVSDKEILATAIKSSIGQTTPDKIKKEFEGDSNVIKTKDRLRTLITTKDAVKEEKQLIASANSFKGKFQPINNKYEVKNEVLNEQQRTAVKQALTTNDGIFIISGKAGTGKTTLMKEVQAGIREARKEIYSFAPAAEASRGVQRSEGFENAETVAKLIQDKSSHPKLKNQLIWIDEAGMLSNRDMNKVIGIAKEQNARIILSGDTRQHNSVQRGDALRIMETHAGIKPITVDKIQRQKNSDYKQAVKMLSEGYVDKGIKKLDGMGAINEITDGSKRIGAIAEDYYKSAYKGKEQKQNVLVIAPTHAEGELVTSSIRSTLKDKKIISEKEKEFTVYKNLQLTEAEKQKPENYRNGNVMIFHQNIKGVKAGTKLEILDNMKDKVLTQTADGRKIEIPITQSKNYNLFEAKKISVAEGDKIRITGNGKTADGKHLFNGTTYNIKSFDKQGNIKLSNGSVLSKEYGHFNLGYVITSHSSQGKTADKVIISQSSATFRASSTEQFYVSVSRGKQAVSIYTDDKEGLKQAVSNSAQRTSAMELLAKNNQIKNTAIENNRLNLFKRMQEKSKEAYSKLKSKIKTNELSRQVRTEPRKAK